MAAVRHRAHRSRGSVDQAGGPFGWLVANESGAKAELIELKERGILGNSHFAMFENNRRQVFELVRGWIEQRVPPNNSTA